MAQCAMIYKPFYKENFIFSVYTAVTADMVTLFATLSPKAVLCKAKVTARIHSLGGSAS